MNLSSHRLEFFITDDNYLINASNFEKERAICRKIADIVIAHRRAIELVLFILFMAFLYLS